GGRSLPRGGFREGPGEAGRGREGGPGRFPGPGVPGDGPPAPGAGRGGEEAAGRGQEGCFLAPSEQIHCPLRVGGAGRAGGSPPRGGPAHEQQGPSLTSSFETPSKTRVVFVRVCHGCVSRGGDVVFQKQGCSATADTAVAHADFLPTTADHLASGLLHQEQFVRSRAPCQARDKLARAWGALPLWY